MKYVAMIQKSEQVTEDSWKLNTYLLDVCEDTTLSEIRDWVLKIRGIADPEKAKFRLDVEIRQVDSVLPFP